MVAFLFSMMTGEDVMGLLILYNVIIYVEYLIHCLTQTGSSPRVNSFDFNEISSLFSSEFLQNQVRETKIRGLFRFLPELPFPDSKMISLYGNKGGLWGAQRGWEWEVDLKMGMGTCQLSNVKILPMKALTQSIDYVKSALSGIPNSVKSGDNGQRHLSAL